MKKSYRGIRPDDLHGRTGLRNPERGLRTEIYFSTIAGEVAGTCSCHSKRNKLDGRSEVPVYQNVEIPGVPHLIRGNRLDGVEFSQAQWQDELDWLAYDGVTIMQSYCFLMKYDDGRELPQHKLDDIEAFFRKVRESGVKALLRFAYELSPSLTGPTAETTLRHLAQLKPLLRKYSDVIYVLQCGFIGKFGEWHNSFHKLQNDTKFHRELLAAVLEALPANRCTMMRYPALKMRLFGTEPLAAGQAFTEAPEARIGHFNDGFMANATHGGTFGRNDSLVSAEKEQSYLAQEGLYLPMDGELFWRDAGGCQALPQEAAVNFNRWHYDTFGMVHGNELFEGVPGYSMDVWKRVPVDPMYILDCKLPFEEDYFTDASGRHVWRSYYEYIRDHLGYRLVLKSAEVSDSCRAGGAFRATVEIVNQGFSSPVNPRPIQLVLRDKCAEYRLEFMTDIRRLAAGKRHVLTLEATLPTEMRGGLYRVGLAMPDGSVELRARPEYAIRCANPLEYSDGINWLGIDVKIDE